MPVYKSKEVTKDGRKWFFKCQYKDVYGETHTMKSKKFLKKIDAEEAEAKFIIENNGIKTNRSITFNSIFIEYIEIQKNKIKKQTITKNTQLNKYISKYLGDINIQDLTVPQYRQFKNKLTEANLSTVYKNKIHNLVKKLIKTAYTLYGINSNVPDICDKFYDVNYEKKEMQFFTLEEYKQFKSVIKELKWQVFFDILFFCGLRQGEAQALTWNDIDFKNATISVSKTLTTKIKGEKWTISTPKTKTSRRILPITKNLLEELKTLKYEQQKIIDFSDSWFVVGNVKPLKETNICNHKNKYCKLANVKTIRIHDFRHSCASFLINNNADMLTVSKYLGHSNVSVTLNTYTHFYEEKLNDIPDLINKICT